MGFTYDVKPSPTAPKPFLFLYQFLHYIKPTNEGITKIKHVLSFCLVHLSPKERGNTFFIVKIPMLSIQRLMCIAEVLQRQTDLLQVLLLHQNPYKYLHSIV
jgi:hypothetical protein